MRNSKWLWSLCQTCPTRPTRLTRWVGSLLLLLSLVASPAIGQMYRRPPDIEVDPTRQVREKVDIKQKLNTKIPLELEFRDEQGKTVRLGDYFGKRPVILTLNYYECPMLCTVMLNELTRALNAVKYRIGKEFEVVTVSISPTETPELAARKKANYVKAYRYSGADKGWHFLTGQETNIRRLADAVGFEYTYDPRTKQYAHPPVVMVLTPDGRLSRYLMGINYSARDFQFAIMEASEGKIGNPVARLVLYCYQYDPSTGKYGLVIIRLVQVGGVLTVVGLGLLIGGFLWWERRHPRTPEMFSLSDMSDLSDPSEAKR
jgi:protein SCO1/2